MSASGISRRLKRNYLGVLEAGRRASAFRRGKFFGADDQQCHPWQHQQQLKNVACEEQTRGICTGRKFGQSVDGMTNGTVELVRYGRRVLVRQQSYAVQPDKADQCKPKYPLAPKRTGDSNAMRHLVKILQTPEINQRPSVASRAMPRQIGIMRMPSGRSEFYPCGIARHG